MPWSDDQRVTLELHFSGGFSRGNAEVGLSPLSSHDFNGGGYKGLESLKIYKFRDGRSPLPPDTPSVSPGAQAGRAVAPARAALVR